MEEIDDLLEKYKMSRKSVLYGTDLFGEEQNLDRLIVMEFVMGLLLIYLMLSPVFWPFLENLNTAFFIYFILFTQKGQHGNQFCRKWKCSISSPALLKSRVLRNFFCQTEFEKVSVIYCRMLFGSTDFLVNLANTNQKICLMLDCRGIKPNGPAFARKPTIQRSKCVISEFKITMDCLFFPRERIRNCELPTEAICFHIEQIRSRTKNNGENFDASGDSSLLASNVSPLFFESLIINGAIILGHRREKIS